MTWADGPAGSALNTQTQIENRFVDWGPYASDHNYQYWVRGNGTPINMRVFEGNPFTNVPNPALYADNSHPDPGGGMPAIVFEYKLRR